jgi:hypothetical protein
MILHACPVCGTWMDISFAQAIKDAWNNTIPNAQLPQGYPCPNGCGLTRHVSSQDRIFVRKAIVEKIVELEQGK